jgi:glycosyltransferase involved in cell wall biosynthesis
MRDDTASGARLLYIQPSAFFGGAERQAATLLPRLVARGLNVTALVGPGPTVGGWLRAAGVRDVHESASFPPDWADARGLERLGRMRAFGLAAGHLGREVAELLRARQIDVVVAAMPFSWVAATPVCRAAGIPILWRAGGTELTWPQRLLLQLWARRHPPDLLVCNSEAVRRMFAPLIPAPTAIVRNGVDTELFRPGVGNRRRFRPLGAEAVIGFAGRLVPQKRPGDFLALAHAIASRHPQVCFLIAGEGSRRPAIEAEARRFGLGDRIHFLGLVQEMRDFYAACDLLVLPSRSEGCPNTVLEAMAMKVAVVASNTEATAEIIQPLRDGLLFPVGRIDRLVEAVDSLLGNPALRARLVDSAWRKVQGPLGAAASARALAFRVNAAMHAPAVAPGGLGAAATPTAT